MNPIEAGKLPDGSPDLFFRGFYCWNSEVGAKTLGMASFYLRLCTAEHSLSYVRCRTMSCNRTDRIYSKQLASHHPS